MKPPLFMECSVCGREFGSKSIQIHEPQCLQKLRRTEIAQQELEKTPPSTTKKIRRKKKTSERKLAMGPTASTEITRVAAAPPTPIFNHSMNSAPSFVIMATTTTSTSNFASIERFNLPKIQSKSSNSGARPCTAVLDKPRILNPEYIQYDMSLTRIDFTGQKSKSSTAIMDENQNNRIQRQNTQILQNPNSRRHGFALPNVLDSNLTVVGHHNYQPQPKHQGKVFRSSDQSKLPPSANMMTTADSILGDPQRKVHGDRIADIGLSLQSGKFWDDDAHHLPNTHTLMSLWSQEIYLMNALSSQLPPLNINPNTQIPCLPPLYDTTKLPSPFTGTSSPQPELSSALSVESLFASPNFPFFGKLSQCDLEKPLRTCFHLEKMPGHRNDFEPQQDDFVTPSSSSEFPQLQQSQPVHLSPSSVNQATAAADDAVADIHPAKPLLETAGKPISHESIEISNLPLPIQLVSQQKRFSQESLIKFDSISNQFGTTPKERQQEETRLMQNETVHLPAQSQDQPELNAPVVDERRDSLNNWIGEPFMQQHAFYTAPFVKDPETDTDTESFYATPVGESQEEHDSVASNDKSIRAAIQELKQFLEGKRTVEIPRNQTAYAMYPVLIPPPLPIPNNNTGMAGNNVMNSVLSSEPSTGNDVKLLASGCPEISNQSQDNLTTPDYSQEETEVSEAIRTDTFEEGDGGADSAHEESTNSMKTTRSSSSGIKRSTPDRSNTKSRNHQKFFSHRAGSDADDESCDSKSTEMPLRRSSTRLKSKTALTKRHQRIKRRSSSTKSFDSLPGTRPIVIVEDSSQSKNVASKDGSTNSLKSVCLEGTSSLPHIQMELTPLESNPRERIDSSEALPETIFSEGPEHSVECGTSVCDKKFDEPRIPSVQITPLPSLESNLDNSSYNGSNQTVIIKAKSTPKEIFRQNPSSNSKQSSVERIFFRAADVEPLVRRRPARTRPKTTGCVEDRVTMWEGIHQVNNSDQTLRNGIDEEIPFQNIPRPPTRRRSSTHSNDGIRLRINLTSAASTKLEKKQTAKVFNTKIQNLISNVNRVGELHRERLKSEEKHLKQLQKQTQRPQTSPPMNYQKQLPSFHGKFHRNRPSTSVSVPAETTFHKNKGSTNKNPRSKRSLSQSATLRAEAPNWNPTARPMTATTAVKFSSRSKPHSMTVRTTFVDNNNLKPVPELYEKSRAEGKSPRKITHSHSRDEEPLELLFSFKTNKPVSKRTLSPLGLASQKTAQLDHASLYQHIEVHRRQALSEAQKVLAKKRSLLRKMEKELSDTSTSALTSPSYSPKRVPSTNNLHRPFASANKPHQTKLILKELSHQVNQDMNKKLAKLQGKTKGKTICGTTKQHEINFVPIPMSKRVHFSSPVQQRLPKNKVSGKPSKTIHIKSQHSSAQRTKNNITTEVENNNNDYSVNTPNESHGKLKITSRKVVKNKVRKYQAMDDEDGDSDEVAGSHDPTMPSTPDVGDEEQNQEPDYDNFLEELEGMRDKIRGKEFERRKRSKGDPGRKGPVYSAVSLYIPRRKKSEKMVDLKIIVRRKNKEGKFPSIDDAVGSLTSTDTYLVVDEEPLTTNAPNPYIQAQMKQSKPKGVQGPNLKITTSEASTVDSLPSVEALNRFMTCYVCGQTLNVRDYFSHERKCVHHVTKNNEYLADEDKRILPPKPQGTITIKHWNNFAQESIKNKLIRCPYCEMEFFPDHQDEVDAHRESCTNRPLPPVAPPRGININEHYTVQMAEEAQGWIVPTAKELRVNIWNQRAERVEQYTRPVENRLRKFKKPKPKEYDSKYQIEETKKKKEQAPPAQPNKSVADIKSKIVL